MTVDLAQRFEQVPIGALTQHPDNARRGDVAVIADSISSNGFFGACVAQRSSGHILIGNHRWLAAAQAGEDSVPVLWVDVDDAAARRIMIADNRTAELAYWDNTGLLASLRELAESEAGLLGTGFTDADLENLVLRFGSAPDLDSLAETYGEHEEQNLWPVLRLVLPPPIMARWKTLRAELPGEDAEVFTRLLELAEQAAHV